MNPEGICLIYFSVLQRWDHLSLFFVRNIQIQGSHLLFPELQLHIDSTSGFERGTLMGVDQEDHAKRYCIEAIGRA